MTEPLEGLRPDARDRRVGRGLAERGQRRDPLRGEPLGVQPPEPGDEDRVVLLASLVAAEVPKVADPAVVDRPRPRLGSGFSQTPVLGVRLLIAARNRSATPSEERDELAGPQRLPLPGPELDVHELGQPPLDPLELLGVEAELEDVERLRRARELRVHGLVRPVGLPLEEVREPAPGPVREVRLVDDVGLAGANRVLGGGARLLVHEVAVLVRAHARDAAPAASSRARYARSCSFPFARSTCPYGSSRNGRSSSPRCTRSSSCVRCAHARWFARSVGESRSVPSGASRIYSVSARPRRGLTDTFAPCRSRTG